jgi:hypothetical protein
VDLQASTWPPVGTEGGGEEGWSVLAALESTSNMGSALGCGRVERREREGGAACWQVWSGEVQLVLGPVLLGWTALQRVVQSLCREDYVLVRTGVYWCVLVCTGAYWCDLVRTGMYWCLLVCTGAYWCVLISSTGRWYMLVRMMWVIL